jgi:N-acetylmuramoyl-L-alanine amidase CwlA
MDYNITQNFITQNRSYKPLIAIGTVLHETATPGASDENERAYFNAAYRGASAHAFVDYNSITQIIPWNEQAWHAGPTANNRYISIELCNYNDASRFEEIWRRGVWLFAYVHVNIIKVTTINEDTLMSHAEVSSKWKETTHTDPIEYFAKFGKTVEDFRIEVQNMINKMLAPKRYYVVTDYIPPGKYGIELNSLWNRYFTGLDIERWYLKSNEKGVWIETQYMPKDKAQALADRLKADNLLWELVEE